MRHYLIIILFCACNIVNAQTILSGIISDDKTLTKKESPYVFRKTLITENTTLTIEEGVLITIDVVDKSNSENTNKLVIDGTIIANGTKENPIYIKGSLLIRSLREENVDRFISKLNHVMIENEHGTALETSFRNVEIRNSELLGKLYLVNPRYISNNNTSKVILCKIEASYNSVSVSNGHIVFDNNTVIGRSDFYCTSSQISNNTFTSHDTYDGFGVLLGAGNHEFYDNKVEEYQDAGLRVYIQEKFCSNVHDNTFKSNKLAIQLDVFHVSKEPCEVKMENCFQFNDNVFESSEEHHVLVKKDYSTIAPCYPVANILFKNSKYEIKENSTIEDYIVDNNTDYELPIRVVQENKEIIVKKAEFNPFRNSIYYLSEKVNFEPNCYFSLYNKGIYFNLPIARIEESGLQSVRNLYYNSSKENRGYYVLQDGEVAFMNSYNSVMAFEQNTNQSLACVQIMFMNLDLKRVRFPYTMYDQQEVLKYIPTNMYTPYAIGTFIEGTNVTSNGKVTLTSYSGNILRGKILFTNFLSGGLKEFKEVEFQLQLKQVNN